MKQHQAGFCLSLGELTRLRLNFTDAIWSIVFLSLLSFFLFAYPKRKKLSAGLGTHSTQLYLIF